MIYFSKSSNGFFLDSINENMPADIVEISADLYNALMTGQQNGGKVIESDDDGYPILVSPEVNHIAQAENQRAQLLATADDVTADWRVELMLGDISDEDKAKLSVWMEYKRKVKEVDTSLAPDIDWPEPPED
ncbi:tail fiber assembly protein [Enterobacter hormaechei]|uniref:tail fiber assembly protein n=1 Tax=Enterobacter hormaechei TaxID=158836 RepID=UPI0005CC99E4|nr:tail fiber assembly protein [Enterobacter hormaechei]KJC01720.1 tail fiber assembly protein [Enterobacter hormaechei]KTG88878.1 phage tail protein [Enterobacter hormaechei subsp. xiangfangensis]KVJ49789.1 phage tail protein [Enterobacter hormaechei subsp. xiangfangensis]MBP1007229.1 tail fiber assembly protein [Enterobacter hormaechei]MBP1031712.1 tail fiber assembly protein [Enterobacter hormaechei]